MRRRDIATVFGGNSLLVHYVVKRLTEEGFIVRVASSRPEQFSWLRMQGKVGQIVPLYASLKEQNTLGRSVEGARIVVNLTGRASGKFKKDFQKGGAKGAEYISRLSAVAGVEKLLHISILGVDSQEAEKTLFLQSHAEAEKAAQAYFPQPTILRTSVVYGPEDKFLNVLAAWGRYMFVIPVIYPENRVQPVYAADVADGVRAAIYDADAAGKTFGFAGPDILTNRQLMAIIAEMTERRQPLVNISSGLMGVAASILRYLPGQLVTPDIIQMLSYSSVKDSSLPGLEELGIVPTPISLVAPSYLYRYRSGGKKIGAVALKKIKA